MQDKISSANLLKALLKRARYLSDFNPSLSDSVRLPSLFENSFTLHNTIFSHLYEIKYLQPIGRSGKK